MLLREKGIKHLLLPLHLELAILSTCMTPSKGNISAETIVIQLEEALKNLKNQPCLAHPRLNIRGPTPHWSQLSTTTTI